MGEKHIQHRSCPDGQLCEWLHQAVCRTEIDKHQRLFVLRLYLSRCVEGWAWLVIPQCFKQLDIAALYGNVLSVKIVHQRVELPADHEGKENDGFRGWWFAEWWSILFGRMADHQDSPTSTRCLPNSGVKEDSLIYELCPEPTETNIKCCWEIINL